MQTWGWLGGGGGGGGWRWRRRVEEDRYSTLHTAVCSTEAAHCCLWSPGQWRQHMTRLFLAVTCCDHFSTLATLLWSCDAGNHATSAPCAGVLLGTCHAVCYTSHVTHHTSHITRYTSHITSIGPHCHGAAAWGPPTPGPRYHLCNTPLSNLTVLSLPWLRISVAISDVMTTTSRNYRLIETTDHTIRRRFRRLLRKLRGKCELTRILYPLLQGFLQPSDVERLGGHVHQHHDLQKLLLSRLAQLLHVVTACKQGIRVMTSTRNQKYDIK